jgi:hypothetical protein
MKNNYLVNCSIGIPRSEERDADYARIKKVSSAWKPIKNADACGNFTIGMLYDASKREFVKVATSKDGNTDYKKIDALEAGGCIPVYRVMPSALWLYRLLCLFPCKVKSEGPEAYKLVWSVSLQHKATGLSFTFYEWKGGFTCGHLNETEPKAFIKDVMELLNLLASDQCLHPYDGVVAGSVA